MLSSQSLAFSAQCGEKTVLHPFAENPATEQQRIDHQVLLLDRINRQPDVAIVAKTISRSHQQCAPLSAFQQSGQFRRRSANARGVELVCALGQLRGTLVICRTRRLDIDFQLQAVDEFSKSCRRGAQLIRWLCCWYSCVRFSSTAVAATKIEGPHMAHKIGNLCVYRREAAARYCRGMCGYFRAFHRVIVQKNKTVQTEFQFLCQRADIVRLSIPIHFPGYEIFPAKRPCPLV